MHLLIETQYHPSIPFFSLLRQSEKLLIENHENYQKQTYRNRCHILTDKGVQPLSVPVKKGNQHTPIAEVEIDYSQRWLQQHIRTIRTAYGSAPYFLFYQDYLWDIYERQPQYLMDLNVAFIKLYLKLLRMPQKLMFTDHWQTTYPEPVLDMRNKLQPKTQPDILHVKSYNQVFGKQFASHLSILDLLFNQGPETANYL